MERVLPARRLLRRRLSSVVLVLCILLLFSAAADTGRRTVRVGFFAFDGYHLMAEDGTKSGYGYDYLQNMLMFANWNYEYVGYDKSWNDMLSLLAAGQIDLVTSASKTPEREKQFLFSDEPIGNSATILTVKSGNTKYTAGDFLRWNGMRVGMLTGSNRNRSFAQYAARNGFSYQPVYFETDRELKKSLNDGTIDAIVTSSLRRIQNEWVLAQFDPQPFYVIVRKNDHALMAEVNKAILQIELTDPDTPTK